MNGNQGVGTMIEVGADKAIKELQSISNLLNDIQGNIYGIAKAVTKTDSITKSTTKKASKYNTNYSNHKWKKASRRSYTH